MITVVGSLNMDLRIETPRLPAPGETVHGRNFSRSPGGKGANQACPVARMGARCALVGAVGDDSFGEELLASLRMDGIDLSPVRLVSGNATGVAMISIDESGQNQIVLAAGANDLVSTEDISRHDMLLRDSNAVLVQLEIPVPAVEATLREARLGGAVTVLNPAPSVPLDGELLGLCDWIVPNEIEAGQLSGMTIRNPDDVRLAAQALRRRSNGAGVVVTLGAEGVWLETDEFSGRISGFAVNAVDTVGAGDTFIGAFVVRLVEGATPFSAARFASAAAAISVTRPGAQISIPSRAEVEAWLLGR